MTTSAGRGRAPGRRDRARGEARRRAFRWRSSCRRFYTAFAHFATRARRAPAPTGWCCSTASTSADIDVEELEVDRARCRCRIPRSCRCACAGIAALVRARPGVARGHRRRAHRRSTSSRRRWPAPHATQMVSALLRHGPGHLRTVRGDLAAWMQEHEWSSLTEMRGNMSLGRIPESRRVRTREFPGGPEMRANLAMFVSWRPRSPLASAARSCSVRRTGAQSTCRSGCARGAAGWPGRARNAAGRLRRQRHLRASVTTDKETIAQGHAARAGEEPALAGGRRRAARAVTVPGRRTSTTTPRGTS